MLHFLISLILLISFIFILIQTLINLLKFFSLSFHSLFIKFPCFINSLTFFGNFPPLVTTSSLKYVSAYFWSTSNNILSSLSFISSLILVKICWIFCFSSSFSLLIFSYNIFKLLMDSSKLLEKFSKFCKLSLNLFIFSSFISSI